MDTLEQFIQSNPDPRGLKRASSLDCVESSGRSSCCSSWLPIAKLSLLQRLLWMATVHVLFRMTIVEVGLAEILLAITAPNRGAITPTAIANCSAIFLLT